MRSNPAVTCAALLFLFSAGMASAAAPRTDINPALLYLQAFQKFPELEPEEAKLLGNSRTGPVSDEERALAALYDTPFKLLHRARNMKARCDWGADISDGPHAYLPNLVTVRAAANVATLRARIALADGNQALARDELLALSTLGRNVAAGSSLVGTMFQVAVDGRVLDIIRSHFDELKPQTRVELSKALNQPTRQSVAEAMVHEQAGFQGWMIDQLQASKAAGSNDQQMVEQFRVLMSDISNDEADLPDRIIEAAGGTGAGLVGYIKAISPYYQGAQAVARSSAADLKRQAAEFEKMLNSTTNLLARVVIPNVSRARTRELEFEERLRRLPNEAP